MRTTLRAHLAALRPVEAVIPSEGLSSLTRKVLLASLRNPRLNSFQPGSEFWTAEETVKRLRSGSYFKGARLLVWGRDTRAALSEASPLQL